DVAQQCHAGLDDVGNRPQRFDGLRPYRTVVARVRRGQHREAVGVLLPVAITAVYVDAADRRAVTADIFGGRMHDDGGAVLDRLAEKRTGRVIHDERYAHLAADPGNFRDRENCKFWVGQRFTIPAAGPRVARLSQVFRVGVGDGTAFACSRAPG